MPDVDAVFARMSGGERCSSRVSYLPISNSMSDITTPYGAKLRSRSGRSILLWGETAKTMRDLVCQLETVPGVGPIVALTAIAVFADVHRFASAKHAASYGGLVPSTFQSGDRDAHGHITTRGSAELRTMLCEAAHHARLANHPLHPHFARACAPGGYKKAVVAVAHRMCRILFAMIRDGSEFRPELVGVEQGCFTRTTTYKHRLTPKPPGRLMTIG